VKRAPIRRTGLGALLATALSLALLAGCGEDGTTPNCPVLPLYDVRDAADVARHQDASAYQMAAENCITKTTPPTFDGGTSGQ
jgi:hypothetical protein